MERPLHNFINRLAKEAAKDFVIGNSSVDYDSFFGSIILAYLLTSSTGRLHMPIIDCPHQELSSRFQIRLVLEKVKLDTNKLIYRESSQATYPLGLYNLYDHNNRSSLQHQVEYIVDHHEPKEAKGRKQLISTMGSGLTMLYYLLQPSRLIEGEQHGFRGKFLEFVEGEGFEKGLIDDEIKEIMLYGILMDTFNLDERQRRRWTIFDKHAAETITSELSKADLWDYQTLLKKKNDVNESKKLTLRQQLGKDRKEEHYNNITAIYSTILLSPVQFYHHYKMAESFAAAALPCEVYFIMAVFENQQGELERELIFKTAGLEEKRIESAINICLGGLGLADLGQLGEWRRWRDPTRTISRKVLQPLIRKECLQLGISKLAQL